MSKVVYAVKCRICQGVRYLKKKPTGPYRCKRCLKTAPEAESRAAPPVTMPARDPWYSDDARKAEINEPTRPGWLPKRPDWLAR